MKLTRKLSMLALAASLSWATLGVPLHAQDAPKPADAPAAPAPAPDAAPAPAPAPAADAKPADAKPADAPAGDAKPGDAPALPAPSLEQRVGMLEAYLTNADPTGRYRLAVDAPLSRAWTISRADLAAAMLAAVPDSTMVGHAVSIAA